MAVHEAELATFKQERDEILNRYRTAVAAVAAKQALVSELQVAIQARRGAQLAPGNPQVRALRLREVFWRASAHLAHLAHAPARVCARALSAP
jgi:hypothetical protein